MFIVSVTDIKLNSKVCSRFTLQVMKHVLYKVVIKLVDCLGACQVYDMVKLYVIFIYYWPEVA